MPSDVAIQCTCAALRGVARGISAETGNRLVCYCDDCQSFAHFLEAADRILDPHGGTDIFQLTPARLELTSGLEQLACMRLTPGGLLRWYASCCRTPIGNTLPYRQVPFVGLIHSCTDVATGGHERDIRFGPIRGGVNARFAKGDRNALDAHDRAPASLLLRTLGAIVAARLRGEHAHSPFFDARTGQPTATPRVLTPDELAAAEAARG